MAFTHTQRFFNFILPSSFILITKMFYLLLQCNMLNIHIPIHDCTAVVIERKKCFTYIFNCFASLLIKPLNHIRIDRIPLLKFTHLNNLKVLRFLKRLVRSLLGNLYATQIAFLLYLLQYGIFCVRRLMNLNGVLKSYHFVLFK